MNSARQSTHRTHWIKVWDAPTRLFHWLLVVLVAAAYFTAKSGRIDWHFYAGYGILALVGFRIIWGFVGSETSRFSAFVRSPRAAIRHLAHLIRRDGVAEAPGHNPAGAFMVIALLALLLFQGTSGLFANDGLFVAGPLAAFAGPGLSDEITAWHGVSFNLILLAVAAHVLAVLLYALVGRENLVRPMITGWKEVPASAAAPRLVPAWKAGLALAVTASAVAAVACID